MKHSNPENLGPFSQNQFGEKYIYQVNRNTFSKIDSETRYRQAYAEALFQPNHLYVIAGSDSGLLIRYLQSRDLPEGSRYVLVELPEVLAMIQAEINLNELPPSIAVIDYENLWSQLEAFSFNDYAYLHHIAPRQSFAAMDAFLFEYRDLTNLIDRSLRERVYRLQAELGSAAFIEAQLENIAENQVPAKVLKGAFKGKTAVVLGGGPSLDDILPWVAENSDKVAVLAVSRISRQLLEKNVQPHLVFSVDPFDVSFDVSREMLQFWDKALFVHSYHVSPLLLGQWSGRSVYLGPRLPWNSELNEDNLGGAGPTVTNSAISVAVAMGFEQVILGGVDLCYGATGISHAQGSNESQSGPRLSDTLTVPTNDGGTAETGADFALAIATMGAQAGDAVKSGCKIINPAPKAAVIDNVEYRPLGDIAIEPLDDSPVATAAALLPTVNSETRSLHYRTMLAEMERAERQLNKMRKLTGEALECNAGLFGRNGLEANFKYKIRMDKIERKLKRDFPEFAPLVKKYSIGSFLKIVHPGDERKWSDEEIERVGQTYYEAYSEGIGKLLTQVTAVKEKLVARLIEETSTPDFAVLAKQWRKDKQTGRLLVWKHHHPEAYCELPDEAKALGEELEEEFRAVMATTDTGHMQKVRSVRSLDGVFGKAVRLFHSREDGGLQRLKEGLLIHPDRVRAEPLGVLIDGYLAELEGQPDKALNFYQLLIGEEFNPLTEEGLKRILTLSFKNGDMENALLALECLANAVMTYKPQYAEMLRLSGQQQSAADVLVDYLEAIPHDLVALLKLGEVYRAMGQEEAARQVFALVLEQDSTNTAAKALLAPKG